MNPKNKRPLYLTSATSVCAGLLIWWNNREIHSAIYEDEYQPLIIGCVMIIVSLLALFFSFKSRRNLIALIPVVLFGLLISRILHGSKFFEFKGCDFSICDELSLYEDGTFYYRRASQIETIKKSGKFEIVNDKVILTPTFWHLELSKVKDLQKINNVKCIQFIPVGFHIPYGNKLCKK